MSVGWRPAAALVIGLLSSACSPPVGTSSTPSVAAPTVTSTPSPTAEPTPRPLPTAGAFPGSLIAGLRTETDVPFTEQLPCGAGACEIPLDALVGHSYGSYLALQTAVDAESDTPGCLADAGGIPDAVVGLAGFGFVIADAVDSRPPLQLISGSEDRAAASGDGATERLREAGFEAEYVELEGIDHFEIVDPGEAPSVLDMIFEAIPPES